MELVQSIIGGIIVTAVVYFIVHQVRKDKASGTGGGGSWKDDKYPNQDKK